MLRSIIIIIGALVLIFFILGVVRIRQTKKDKMIVLEYIKKHPNQASIKLIRNDSVLASLHEDRIQPLASTVKLILVIEYAVQAAQGIIDPEELVDISELSRFYVEHSDGGAHPAWLKAIGSHIENNKVSIKTIVKGMIMYSSNANTEWLTRRLSLEKINKQLVRLGMQHHSEIYYLVSSLFVGKELFPELEHEALEHALKALPSKDYIEATKSIHEKLLNDSSYKKNRGDRSLNIQKIWSDKLPASSVSEYAELMKKINSRTYFSKDSQIYIDEVLEFLLENPKNRQWLRHCGMKGGSTAFVLTKALYATDKQGNTTELAYFFNDLEYSQNRKLQNSMNAFELAILNDAEFRTLIQSTLN